MIWVSAVVGASVGGDSTGRRNDGDWERDIQNLTPLALNINTRFWDDLVVGMHAGVKQGLLGHALGHEGQHGGEHDGIAHLRYQVDVLLDKARAVHHLLSPLLIPGQQDDREGGRSYR